MAGKDCPLCASLGRGDNNFSVRVTELPFADVRLERRSALPGYCIVVWNRGHVAEPTELDADNATGFWREVLRVGRAIEQRFEPLKLNYSTLGNTVPHLHTHVVPRYPDDPAPAGPLPWEEMFTSTPQPSDVLAAQAADLRTLLST